jgi:Protein of unknown function (DUF3575)
MGLSTALFSTAQSNDSTVTVIFAGAGKKSSSKTRKKIGDANIIKLAPTGIFTGQIPLIYERKLSDNVSIQIGAGLSNQSYMRGMLMTALDKEKLAKNYPSDWPSYGFDESEELYKFSTRKVEMGTTFSIQPKYYFSGDVMDGGFIGFSYNVTNYKFSMPKATATGSDIKFNGPLQSESEKVSDYMLHYGIQHINDHFSIEYAASIGIRKVEGVKYVAFHSSSKVYDGFSSYQQNLLNYEAAIRIGYVF